MDPEKHVPVPVMKENILPSAAFSLWAESNGIRYHGVTVNYREDRGYAVVATRDISPQEEPLITVPRELVLSAEAVHAQARSDRYLRGLLEAAQELSTVCFCQLLGPRP